MRNLPRNKEGKKMYPVCSWEKNQHKVYTEHDRAMVLMATPKEMSEEEHEWVEKVDRAMEMIDRNIIEGIVYATWEDGLVLKDVIWGYNARH